MANICMYKIKVVGTKQACYALVNMMPLYSYEKEFLSEDGNDNEFTLVFTGDCKWGVDCYTSAMTNPKPFTKEELDAVCDGDHWDKTLRDKSVLLDCEIFCNSKDIDDSCWSIFEHYNRGKEIRDECPKELHIKRGRDYDCYDDVVINIGQSSDALGRLCRVKFEKGAYDYAGDYEVGDLVYVDGAKSGQLGRVVSTKDNEVIEYIYQIQSSVGHADPFIETDIEAIWKSYKPQERKEYLGRLGFDPTMTKKKFISIMDHKWTLFAAKNNDWNAFLTDVKNATI
jgi:hypothetical protein